MVLFCRKLEILQQWHILCCVTDVRSLASECARKLFVRHGVCVDLCVCLYVCVFVYVCMCVCVCVCMHLEMSSISYVVSMLACSI